MATSGFWCSYTECTKLIDAMARFKTWLIGCIEFSHHIKEKVHKANRLLGLIKRTFKSLEPQMLRNLYTALIRPHLDYACVICNPYQLGAIGTLQRSATRAFSPLRHLP